MNTVRPYATVVNSTTGEIMPIETNIFLTSLRRDIWRHDLAESVASYLK